MTANRPPAADFVWSPALIYEGDDVTLTNLSEDPDGDVLTYLWTITTPGGAVLTRTTEHAVLENAERGMYTVTLRASEAGGGWDEVTKSFAVLDLGIAGEVRHTPEWEAYRLSWNARFPGKARCADTFWAGEAFILAAEVTDTGASATKPVQVTAELVGTGGVGALHSNDLVHYAGEMVEPDFAAQLADGWKTMRFRVRYSNGHEETHDVPVRIEGSVFDVIVVQHRL